jgi:hypothetical protein
MKLDKDHAHGPRQRPADRRKGSTAGAFFMGRRVFVCSGRRPPLFLFSPRTRSRFFARVSPVSSFPSALSLQIFTIVDKAWVDVLIKVDKGARRRAKPGVFVPALGEDRLPSFSKAGGGRGGGTGGGSGGAQRRRSLQE